MLYLVLSIKSTWAGIARLTLAALHYNDKTWSRTDAMTCAAFAAADLEGKTDEGKSGRRTDLESVISFNKALEQLGKAQVVLDVVLQSLLSVGP